MSSDFTPAQSGAITLATADLSHVTSAESASSASSIWIVRPLLPVSQGQILIVLNDVPEVRPGNLLLSPSGVIRSENLIGNHNEQWNVF